jgi:glycosyltransferase involved in cell wall biosynthesis
MLSSTRRLLIISHEVHFTHEGRLFAYGPYAIEVDLWADLFPEIIIAAPLRRGKPPGDALAFSRRNIVMAPQVETGGDSFRAKVIQLLALPSHFWRLARAMRQADAIQVRCAGNLGLLGVLLAPCFRKPRVAKYANQWNGFPAEPWSWRWQRWLLRSSWWSAPVLVYGDWPDQPPHIIPFFTSMLDEAQMARARAVPPRDWMKCSLEVLFVGRLSMAKNVDVLVRALGRLKATVSDLQLRIVGDGPARKGLEALSVSLGVGDRVHFEGAVPQARVLDFYERAHILVLASMTEGWPKAIAEGMAFGLVCIGSNRGLVPQMLGEGKGLIVEPGDVHGLAGALTRLAREPALAESISRRASAWAQQFTLEGFRDALRGQLETSWKVRLNRGHPTPELSGARA